jgi:hypothetical protein
LKGGVKLEVVQYDGRRWFCAGNYDPESRVLVKQLAWQHLLRRPPAIAVQASVLNELESLNALGVVTIMPNGRRLFATLEDFRRYGIAINRGFGEQVALPLKRWREQPAEAQLTLNLGG